MRTPPNLASSCPELAHPKGPTRRELKGQLDYRERQIIDRNRAKCVRRDGTLGCRIGYWQKTETFGDCYGASEWNHFDKRSLTMNEPAEERHSSRITGMLCGTHHTLVDNHEIKFEYQTEDGADGLMTFWNEHGKLEEHKMPRPNWSR
jgi:hypothetical protein